MSTGHFFHSFDKTPTIQALLKRVEAGGVLSLDAVPLPAQPFLTARLRAALPSRPMVVVTPNLRTQESFHQDLETWLNLESPKGPSIRRSLFFPSWETLPHEDKLPHADVISERLETLVGLLNEKDDSPPLVVAGITSLTQKTFPPAELRDRIRTLKRGDIVEPLDLVEWLEDQAYESEAQVTQRGDVAMRGGIVDVYPLTSPWPVRLEFFGDELESLRYFDPASQISREEIESVTLPPGGELGILRQAQASSNEQPLATLLDYLPANTIFIFSEPESIQSSDDQYAEQVPENDPFYFSIEELRAGIANKQCVTLELQESEHEKTVTSRAHDWRKPVFDSLEAHRPVGDRPPEPQIAEAQRREFFAQLHRWLRQGYHVEVFCNNDGEEQRFKEIWNELDFKGQKKKPKTQIGSIGRGFLFEEGRLVVVTDAEIFGRYKVQRPRRLKSPHASVARSALDIDFTELEFGDLVVHLQHGIGRYCGLVSLPGVQRGKVEASGNGAKQECLVIEYAPRDTDQPAPKLYVPVTEAHLVSKYVGAGKLRPPLNSLGSSRWTKAKEQAEMAIRDLAADLLAIHAKREAEPGFAFGEDTPWQREFESSFIYEETTDQIQAIEATKMDLEKPKPMDRLICGDVGFGKTEVAIRAAFKAVMNGRQVAILVPTTVLAQQHHNTLTERMADYPIRVELLSRFRTVKEQARVIGELASGTVDIVVGTHRLVQRDVVFKELGLVVIDEEQRFGVLHKEKFKMLRSHVDVLTLSATPIPRTLYLALTGAWDMSTIQTPPQDRLPVETIVGQYDERLIRDAIRRELNRGGQVFFLHNRVTTIDVMRGRLATLLPDARIVVGHGQMKADDLEEVMTTFVNGQADILLSTSIIESGLDIPNANTIIIDRADRFGLSELYQLRGRVGRYKHQAYAYLLLPRHARLLTDVRKRMSAIKQYAQLGSGFKIAMRDLEIRGAGNLLGSQQSGHITAVGFDLYCQLLKQSVSTLKGEKVKPRVRTELRLDFLAIGFDGLPQSGDGIRDDHHKVELANLPMNYVAEPEHRVEIYRKIAQADERADVTALEAELKDRFGPVPKSATLLLQTAELKILASTRAISVLETKGDKLMITRHGDFLQLGGKFPRLTKKNANGKLKEIKKLLLAL